MSDSQDGRVTRAERRSEETRKLLLDTARSVFNRQGYQSTSVDDIVREAQVSRGTFYLYFTNKKDVLDAVLGDRSLSPEDLRSKCRATNNYGHPCLQQVKPQPTEAVSIKGFCGVHTNLAFMCGTIVQEIVTFLHDHHEPVLAQIIAHRYGLTEPEDVK